MANICDTVFYFHGRKNDIEKFHRNLYTAMNATQYMLKLFDLVNKTDINPKESGFDCRGNIYYMSDIYKKSEDHYFSIDVDSAWAPPGKLVEAYLEWLNLDISFSYISVEPGFCLYQIYDPHNTHDFDGYDYCVDALESYDEFDVEYGVNFYSEDKTIALLQKILKTNENDIDKLLNEYEKYCDKNQEPNIRINRCERVDELYS